MLTVVERLGDQGRWVVGDDRHFGVVGVVSLQRLGRLHVWLWHFLKSPLVAGNLCVEEPRMCLHEPVIGMKALAGPDHLPIRGDEHRFGDGDRFVQLGDTPRQMSVGASSNASGFCLTRGLLQGTNGAGYLPR